MVKLAVVLQVVADPSVLRHAHVLIQNGPLHPRAAADMVAMDSLRCAAAAFLLAIALTPAQASDTHAVAPPPPPPPAVPAASKQDPMDRLRERLAEKLGAVHANQANPNVLRVTARTPEGAPAAVAAAAPARPARPVAPKPPAGHWDYTGAHGPAHWGALKPEFATCSSGSSSSRSGRIFSRVWMAGKIRAKGAG